MHVCVCVYTYIYRGETVLIIRLYISRVPHSHIVMCEGLLVCLGLALVFPCVLLLEQMGLSFQKGF